MVTLFTLTVICVVAVILIPIVLTIIGLPLMLLRSEEHTSELQSP